MTHKLNCQQSLQSPMVSLDEPRMNLLPHTRSIKELHDAFRSGRATPLDETRSALARSLDKCADHVFNKLTAGRALAAAERSTRRYALGDDLGLLDGINIAWKDIFDQRGEITTAGSKTRASKPVSKCNAKCVDLLENAGVCSLGRTNLSEFAFSGLGINPHFGTPANALSQDQILIPGGSSSGSAVAVALGIATVGIGTDTSGSVRVPAALNGIVGFRPSQARYDRTGVFPLSDSLDTVGTFARTVEDIAAVDRLLKKPGSAASPATLDRVIYDLADSLETQWDGDIYDQYVATLQDYEKRGFKIEVKRLNALRQTKELFQQYGTLVAIEAKRLHRRAINGPDRHLLDPVVAERLQRAPEVSASIYQVYLRKRADLITDATTEIGGSIIAYPTVPEGAPSLSELMESAVLASEKNARMLSNTMIASFLDLPGITIPTGDDGNECPGSILLSGPRSSDDALLWHAQIMQPIK